MGRYWDVTEKVRDIMGNKEKDWAMVRNFFRNFGIDVYVSLWAPQLGPGSLRNVYV
jgi:hypothetical protein